MATFNPYTVGVRLVMHDEASTALAAIAGHFIGLGHHIGHATAQARRFQVAVAGAATAFGGQQLGKAIGNVLQHGAELLKIQNQMTAAGWTQVEIAQATAEAWKVTAKHQSMGVSKILEMQKEMAPVIGDKHHAIELAEQMTKMQVVMQGILGPEKGGQFVKQIRDAIRAAELAGDALKPERFNRFMDGLMKMVTGMGGTVMPSDVFMAIKYGRASALNWSDEFREQILPTLIQELGGSSTGTAMMSLYQALIGGMMRNRSVDMFDKLGLIDHSKVNPETDLTKEGRIKRMKPDFVKGTDLFMSNPYAWVSTILFPAMKEHGIATPEGLAEIMSGNIKDGAGGEARKALTKTIAVMLQNRTAQGMVDLFAIQPYKIERDAKLLRGAFGTDAGSKLFEEKDYGVALKAFHEQWENLMTALASPNMAKATAALKEMNNIITSLGGFFVKSPGMAEDLGLGAVMLAISALVVGLGMLAGAIFGLVGGIIVVVGAVLGFIGVKLYQNWEAVKAKLDAASKWLSDLTGGWSDKLAAGISAMVKSMADRMGLGLLTLPGLLAGAIAAMVTGIASAIGAGLAAIGSKIGNWFKGGDGPAGPKGKGDGWGDMYRLQSYTPPARAAQPIQIRSDIHLDGHQVARSVVQRIVDDGHHVGGPATYDGVAAPTPVDLVEA